MASGQWRYPSGVVADVLRLVALVSATIAWPTQPLEAVLRFLLIFGGLVAVRQLEIPRPFDAWFGALLLFSAWSSALGWYHEHPWIDIPIHFLLTGAAAAVLYFAVARLHLLPQPDDPTMNHGPGVVLVVALLGTTVAVLWEFYEWLVHTYVPSEILVGYDDTIGDLANGLAGSVVAGACMAWWLASGHGLRRRP